MAPKEKNSKVKKRYVYCSVKNCKKKVLKDEAIIIDGNYFCKLCGVALFRTKLNI
jgi:hypothetical protein